jgi:hypothetical protein
VRQWRSLARNKKENALDFRVTGLPAADFQHLYGLKDEELRKLGVIRYTVDSKPGFPDRIEMRDGEIGETMLLINHVYQPSATPYHASHAIFVREGATERFDRINDIPEVMRIRLLSLRSFDTQGMMLDADVVEGSKIEKTIHHFFKNDKAAYIQVHNAKRGCYSGRIDRA